MENHESMLYAYVYIEIELLKRRYFFSPSGLDIQFSLYWILSELAASAIDICRPRRKNTKEENKNYEIYIIRYTFIEEKFNDHRIDKRLLILKSKFIYCIENYKYFYSEIIISYSQRNPRNDCAQNQWSGQ